ncbi:MULTISPECIES: acyl-CoA dehydrogenase family protein [Kitasatospora]|uniref:Acyl-CoA dehydrogenase/oxidase C-terminal domain-containing protein n=1 Tax=Kitasatospora setae (strain ATCC 33774 / DSM 43861 / JCM 3304 / KCC A-0304 / NBRC 14216 / KM-6054) TaxID=452652 RepID=E4N2G7_KITSK|nr:MULTISPECIES: acyl-CoA dehydrogenase family protein [Kitasatospora]BAJ32351.1 hypothetical protein KSE_65920 [Kitasatospora setae KM-6054]
MTDQERRLAALRGLSAELAPQLRAVALDIDRDPAGAGRYHGLEAYRLMHRCQTPAEYGGEPLRIGSRSYPAGSCLDYTTALLELAKGDCGAVLAAPGPALAGLAVSHLGSPEQQARFHRRLADGTSWSFFAITEPERGSDASALATRLDRAGADRAGADRAGADRAGADRAGAGRGDDGRGDDGYLLTGTKRYIGSGERGGIGVVFARTGPGPLSIRAALVERPLPGSTAQALEMTGLRGARLAEIRFEDVPIAAGDLLGAHLPPSRRGLWGAMRAFTSMRVQIAALALGAAAALAETVDAERPNAPGAAVLRARLAAARARTLAAAAQVDHDPDRGDLAAAAKLTAVRLGTGAARWAVRSLGRASMLDHPLLEKWYRDVHAFEFMEGTSNIQRVHVAEAYRNRVVRRG